MLGFNFDYHRHGNGPFHYASDDLGFTFEIYPTSKSSLMENSDVRLGFDVENLSKIINKLSGWEIITMPKQSEWGLKAVIQDLDGRKIELLEK